MAEDDKPSGYLGQVLGYVNSPFRLVAVVVLGLVGGGGYVAYQHSDEIIESWLTPSSMSLKTQEVSAALEKLVNESGADLIQVWSVDLAINSQRFVAARRKDGERPVIPDPRRLPAISKASDLGVLADLIAGHPSCLDISTASPSPVAHRLAERGMTRACGVPIPPSPEAFVGMIYMSWEKAPGPGLEDVAVSAAREIAGKLVTR